MATKVFNYAKGRILQAYLASRTLRVALLMTNTTADTENDGISFVDEIATLDEFDGANYVRKELSGGVVTVNDANDRGELDFADVTWTALGAGTRSIAGILVFEAPSGTGTGDEASPVGWWLEFPSPKTPDGSDFVLSINDLLRAV